MEIKNGKLLNAAIALYGKRDSFYPTFPQFSIKLARFRGNNRLAEFADNRWYQDHAFGILRRAENFLFDYMPIASKKIPGKMRREDYPLYPPLAFKEAVANAICHRDYTFAGGSVAIAMYDNFLEVISHGKFHFNITPEKLIIPHASKPWNPLIANAFYVSGIIESWGSGTLNILDECKENKNPLPKWEERTGSVVVTFSHRKEQKRPKSRPKLRPKSRPEPKQKTLSERILNLLQSGPFSSSEIANNLGHQHLSGNLKKTLKTLLESGEIEFTIPDKKRSRLQKYKIKKDKSYE